MSKTDHIRELEKHARAVLGPAADTWFHRPNRRLAELAPDEIAADPCGERIIHMELERLAALPEA